MTHAGKLLLLLLWRRKVITAGGKTAIWFTGLTGQTAMRFFLVGQV